MRGERYIYINKYIDCGVTYCSGQGTCNVAGVCTCIGQLNAATSCSSCLANYYNYPACTCKYPSFTASSLDAIFNFLLQFVTRDKRVVDMERAQLRERARVGLALAEARVRLVRPTTTATQPAHVCHLQNLHRGPFLIYSFSLDCLASSTCHGHGACNSANGACICNQNFDSGSNCGACAPNHYNYPVCSCISPPP